MLMWVNGQKLEAVILNVVAINFASDYQLSCDFVVAA